MSTPRPSPPQVLKGGSLEDAKAAAVTHLKLTHDSRELWRCAEVYAELLYALAKVSDDVDEEGHG